ncbi:hypothetical protein [Marinospirillum sp.]|nr:hypothetical protein [Marinospirillum sp.]
MSEHSFFVQFLLGLLAAEAVNICLSATEKAARWKLAVFKVH